VKVRSLVLAGATLFVPHAGKLAAKVIGRPATPPLTAPPTTTMPVVTVATTFRIPPAAFEGLIQDAARAYALDANLIRAVIRAESGFDPNALSEAGAQGLMQLMPALAAELGVRNAFDPRENVMAGARYLAYLLTAHNGDIELALASYNAGPAAVEKYNGVPPFPETRQYIKSITDRLSPP